MNKKHSVRLHSLIFLESGTKNVNRNIMPHLKEAAWTFNIFSHLTSKLDSFTGCFYMQLKHSLRNGFTHEFFYL